SEIRVQTVIRTAGCVRAVDLRDLLKTGDIDNLWLKSCMLSLRKKVCRAVCDLARMLPLISRAPHQVREVEAIVFDLRNIFVEPLRRVSGAVSRRRMIIGSSGQPARHGFPDAGIAHRILKAMPERMKRLRLV